LDDGGHTYTQQVISSELVLDSISNGGVLVVEDTHTSYAEGFGDRKLNFMRYVANWIEKINTRFGSFDRPQNDRRVWSVEIFESIVAFKINRPLSELKSEPIWNTEPLQMEKDFRHEDQLLIIDNEEEISTVLERAFSVYQDE
jgi:hypothetical protein